MKKWSDEDGEVFSNSAVCFGKEFKPIGTDAVDIAKISIRGEFPSDGKWGYLEESHEMAVVLRGEGYIETKEGKHTLREGDVVHVEPLERFRWGGDMDLIVPCGPAFNPSKHKIEEAS
jgi:mannose-6-phosphate isomerase-like protein (cupin superfamily)